ncbi:MAG: hypothetical protein EHM70_03845, partial [Chloroflexota bacterium]
FLKWQNNRRLSQVNRQVTAHASIKPGQKPVVFFNATTRLVGVSQNAAFAFLAASAVQLAGVPVVHFACRSGLYRCVLGTNREDPQADPPCAACVAQSGWLFANAPTVWFDPGRDESLSCKLKDLGVEVMGELVYQGIPLGELVTPSLRWSLRRHHFNDDEPTRFLYREYIHASYRLIREFGAMLDQVDPACVVVFNGIMYPEASARWAARRRGLRVITHEVGMRPFSAFFTSGDATAYPIDIPASFDLLPEQNARLDQYLEQRFKGMFSMAGIRFWPEMAPLSQEFLARAAGFRQIVPVFTNVIFDTSQIHANMVFPHMFAWLDLVLEIIRSHPETLFVIRAHPDELRPGKESRESVQDWVKSNRVQELPNVVFFNSNEYISSYELIQRAKFVMVYNSSIGLEASLLGAAVLCGGKARFTQIPTVFFPETQEAYRQQAEAFLAGDSIDIPDDFRRNARRFLYYQLFRTSLPFDDFMEPHPMPGFVNLRPLYWQKLTPQASPALRAILDGILNGGSFLLEE